MFRFISTLDKVTLQNRYLKLFGTIKSKEKEFSRLLTDYSLLNDIIPEGYRSFSSILVAPFEVLAKIYYGYREYIETLGNSKAIDTAIISVFNYGSYSTKIGHFLVDPSNGFPVHNCNYCDLHKIVGYTEHRSGRQVREFETEHILDKGQCPIVALSIYNFVPSCGTCNDQHHKGSDTFGRTIEETILLSPTTSNNRFEEEVTFTLLPLRDDIRDLIMFESDDDLEIDFKGATDKYERTIDLFRLKDRYNANKSSILEIVERMRTWSIGLGLKIVFESDSQANIFESIFQFKRRARAFEPMEKCRRDIFEDHFGKIPE